MRIKFQKATFILNDNTYPPMCLLSMFLENSFQLSFNIIFIFGIQAKLNFILFCNKRSTQTKGKISTDVV